MIEKVRVVGIFDCTRKKRFVIAYFQISEPKIALGE